MFCWQCGGGFNRGPDGAPIFLEVPVDGIARKVHVVCSDSVLEETHVVTRQPADEVPPHIQREPERTYG